MRMPPKRPIGGSGDAGAAKAPEHGVEMETEVAVTAGELSLHPDAVDDVELPQPEAEFHTDFDDHYGYDSSLAATKLGSIATPCSGALAAPASPLPPMRRFSGILIH